MILGVAMKKILIAVCLCCAVPVAATGCSLVQELMAPRADGSSMEAFYASIERMKADMTPEDRLQLDKAIAYQHLMYFKDNTGAVLVGGIASLFDKEGETNAATKGVEQDFLRQFDGKTAKQILRDYENANK